MEGDFYEQSFYDDIDARKISMKKEREKMNIRKEIRKVIKEGTRPDKLRSTRGRDIKDLNKWIESFGGNVDDASHALGSAIIKLEDLDEMDDSISLILEPIRTKLSEIEKLLEKADKRLQSIAGYDSIYAPKGW